MLQLTICFTRAIHWASIFPLLSEWMSHEQGIRMLLKPASLTALITACVVIVGCHVVSLPRPLLLAVASIVLPKFQPGTIAFAISCAFMVMLPEGSGVGST